MHLLTPDVSRTGTYIFLSSLSEHQHVDQLWDLGVHLLVLLSLFQLWKGPHS